MKRIARGFPSSLKKASAGDLKFKHSRGVRLSGIGHLLDLFVAEVVQLGVAWQPSPDATVGILDPAFLPGRIRIAKLCREAERVFQQGMLLNLSAVVTGH